MKIITSAQRSPLPSATEVGRKGLGLFSIPPAWTKPFIVLSRKEAGEATTAPIPAEAYELNLTTPDIEKTLRLLRLANGRRVILRSSSLLESMRERGRYHSKTTHQSPIEIKLAFDEIVDHHSKFARNKDDSLAAIIVQEFAKPITKGHLSNERRVSRSIQDWVWEHEAESSKAAQFGDFSTGRNVEQVDSTIPLVANSNQSIQRCLRQVARHFVKDGVRVHIEWIWDGEHVWIVQRDSESKPPTGKPKGTRSTQNTESNSLVGLEAFKHWRDCQEQWPKLDCLRVFDKCKIPTTDLYVLDAKEHIHEIVSGRFSPSVIRDLEQLLKSPIVVRTDLLPERSISLIPLSPRTDTVANLEEAKKFLHEQASDFITQGLHADEFCFLAHRFIQSKASAFGFGVPGVPRVRVDSTWGLPDGLAYYSHDSFEYDAIADKLTARKIRCKDVILEVSDGGKWIGTEIGPPWDWRTSLSHSELREIARLTSTVSDFLKRQIQLMFFVLPKGDQRPYHCLPWVFSMEGGDTGSVERGANLSGTRLVIRSWEDLEYAESYVANELALRRVLFRLRPTPDLLRSKEFINRIAGIAVDRKIGVELEGSVLQHIYYMLRNAGVSVRCVNLFTGTSRKRAFGKLVRDKIPSRIELHGEQANIVQASPVARAELLKEKAVEEAYELMFSGDANNELEELADIVEVVRGLSAVRGYDMRKVLSVARRKRTEKGGFDRGVVLLKTQERPLIPEQRSQEAFRLEGTERLDQSQARRESSRTKERLRLRKIKGGKFRIPLIPNKSMVVEQVPYRVELLDGRILEVQFLKTAIEICIVDPEEPIHDDRQLQLFPTEPGRRPVSTD